tara:strand:- start:94 stop:1203 length:1110 start_codon:yes stop_codon:yes gene_type:complete
MVASKHKLILHCGGVQVDFEALHTAEMPPESPSYVPVSHGDYVFNISKIGGDILHDYELEDAAYALAPGRAVKLPDGSSWQSETSRMFGIHTYRKKGNGGDEMRLALAFRNSYDKSMSLALASGSYVFICDNLGFSGSVATIFLKCLSCGRYGHTGNVLDRLPREMVGAIYAARRDFVRFEEESKRFKEIPIDDDAAYRVLGQCYGRKILTHGQLNRALDAWRDEGYRSLFGVAPTAWTLYNCATEALKGLPMEKTMEAHVNLHETMREIEQSGLLRFEREAGMSGDEAFAKRIDRSTDKIIAAVDEMAPPAAVDGLDAGPVNPPAEVEKPEEHHEEGYEMPAEDAPDTIGVDLDALTDSGEAFAQGER